MYSEVARVWMCGMQYKLCRFDLICLTENINLTNKKILGTIITKVYLKSVLPRLIQFYLWINPCIFSTHSCTMLSFRSMLNVFRNWIFVYVKIKYAIREIEEKVWGKRKWIQYYLGHVNQRHGFAQIPTFTHSLTWFGLWPCGKWFTFHRAPSI